MVQAAVQTIVAQNRLANLSKMVAAGQAEPGQALLSNSEDMKRMSEAARYAPLHDLTSGADVRILAGCTVCLPPPPRCSGATAHRCSEMPVLGALTGWPSFWQMVLTFRSGCFVRCFSLRMWAWVHPCVVLVGHVTC